MQFPRIAIVLDSFEPPAWIAAVVASIVRDCPLQAVVVLKEQRPTSEHSYLFARYLAWDAKRYSPGPDPLAPVDVSKIMAGIPAVALTALPGNIDVLLWLSNADPSRFPFVPSRYGTWFFRHGARGESSLTAAYFSELARQDPVTSSWLLAITDPAQEPVKLSEAHTASEIGWSLSRHRTAPFWKAATLPSAALDRLGMQLVPSIDLPTQHRAKGPNHARAEGPSSASVLAFAARNVFRTISRRLQYANKEAHWFVAYRTNREEFVPHKARFSSQDFRILPAPVDHFYADPFVLTWRDRTFLFVEDYLYTEARGVLSVLELQADGQFGKAREILNRPYHLSYPFVFEHAGEVFLIPETMAARRIELYRAVDMPDRWELVKILLENVEAVDTTLWIENGVFYFFTNLSESGMTPNDLLYLFTADSLTGEWQRHPANPVSRDVRAARGAGKLFRMGNTLVRPAQDCSVRYGYATQLNRIDVLTPDQFRETPLFRIEPDWAPNLIGTHTINSNDTVEVIDGQIYRAKYRRRAEES